VLVLVFLILLQWVNRGSNQSTTFFRCQTWAYNAFFACNCWTGYWSLCPVDGDSFYWQIRYWSALAFIAFFMYLCLPGSSSLITDLFNFFPALSFLGPVELGSAGVSVMIFNNISKLFNIPLLSVATSFVAEDIAKNATKDTTSGINLYLQLMLWMPFWTRASSQYSKYWLMILYDYFYMDGLFYRKGHSGRKQ